MIKKILLSGLSLLVLTSVATGQNFEYSNIELTEASFSGDLTIRTDDGTSVYVSPEFVNGSSSDPVAYVSGDTPNMSVDFTFDCENAPDSIMIRGVAPEGMEFPETKVELVLSSGTVYDFTYPATDASSAFAAGVTRMFKPFKVGWDISFDDGTTWRPVDSTANTMYVTYDTPMAETGDFKLWQTIYDISCRNADGESTETDIIAGIWGEFTDQDVHNWEGDSLHYYKPMYTFNTTLQALLNFKNAQCYTFAKLWLACIKIQGIVRTDNYVYITPINNTVCGNTVNRFIVKNWTFNTASAAGECPSFPYKNTYNTLIPWPYTSYDFIQEDVSDEIGITGQNSPNPSSYFNNHQITFIDGVYYDASYGVSFSSIEDIPDEAFDGWGYRYNSGGVTHALFTDDLSLSSLQTVVSTF